jgi:lysophospholipase L1-like esterase
VLLVEHAGYTDGLIQLSRAQAYTRVNKIQKEAYDQLKTEGITELYYLTKEEIDLQLDDMVDGTHPNDLGMMHYAEGYEKNLRSILDEPIGMTTTTRPCIQYREPGNYDWEGRHREILKMNEELPPRKVILANSIIHFWGGEPKTKVAREEASWKELFTPMGVRNLAYGWDRIENVLWRIYHGELEGFQAEKVVVMIGTNNLHLNSNEEILTGLEMIMHAIKARQPNSEVLFMGLLPRSEQEIRVKKVNTMIEQLCINSNVQYADIGNVFLKEDQMLNETLFSDGLHPNKAGYLIMRDAIRPLLE